jgi:YHS domain-containing protein
VAKDPVCGMMVDEKRARYVSEFKGAKYYFCSSSCKSSFDREPQKYVA